VSASVADRFVADARAGVTASTIPWPLYAVVLASTCIVVGLIWDVSWHRTVGRDTFWTLAHVLEQLAAVIAGLSCGWIVLRTTFAGTPEAKAQSVRFWGFFQGPLGAWVCIWGTLMMITSAPFDSWWHNAYGLDVKIISPPHMILAWGMIGIQIGAMLMALSAQNRASGEDQRMYSIVHAYTAGILAEASHAGTPFDQRGAISFPYAFPKPGRYHMWVQTKHAGRILTGAFAFDVESAT
jgi:hypothetical protein